MKRITNLSLLRGGGGKKKKTKVMERKYRTESITIPLTESE